MNKIKYHCPDTQRQQALFLTHHLRVRITRPWVGQQKKNSLVFKLMKLLWFNDTDLSRADRYKTAICWNGLTPRISSSGFLFHERSLLSSPCLRDRMSSPPLSLMSAPSPHGVCHFYFMTWYCSVTTTARWRPRWLPEKLAGHGGKNWKIIITKRLMILLNKQIHSVVWT